MKRLYKSNNTLTEKPKKNFFGFLLAGEERFELSSTVLETAILPLNYSPKRTDKLLACPFRSMFD